MHLPEIDKYAHLDSPLHRWDVRVKVACLACLILAEATAPNYPLALCGLFLSLGLVMLTGIPLGFAFLHVRWVLGFCAIFLIVMPLTAGQAGLRAAGLISVRALAAALSAFVMMATARFDVTLKAMRALGIPARAVQILAFSYRYIFVLFDELHRMLAAARARCSGRARGLRALGNAANIIGMLMVRSVERTRRVYQAMLARGYRGDVRTLHEFSLRPADALLGTAVLGAAACLLVAGLVG